MTLAGRMREAAKQIKEFNYKSLYDAMEVCSYKERAAVRFSMRDFLKRGEFRKVSPGLYQYVGRKEKTTFRQRLWDIARRMIHFTLDDLEQITEGNRETIKEFCTWMIREGYASRIGRGQYRVIGKLKPNVPKGQKRN